MLWMSNREDPRNTRRIPLFTSGLADAEIAMFVSPPEPAIGDAMVACKRQRRHVPKGSTPRGRERQ